MTAKTFEVRDRGTFIAVLAVRCDPSCPRESRMLWRSGFSSSPEGQAGYVILSRLEGGYKSHNDPYEWGDRTMQVAHNHLIDNFESLENCSVVDVEFILGETAAPKPSELSSMGV